ncbi:phosphatase PAP2 family protein [Rhodoblastus acidophilus]|uniref:Phosphatase PAP2 family protein n=1 Tax=Rhodoblastus acidophilus TaxID=1074 RepID=A0A6N8DQA9_RHOAC|nr:phosphatase PAP2 family protein [Rhodoblastus acidophilus]
MLPPPRDQGCFLRSSPDFAAQFRADLLDLRAHWRRRVPPNAPLWPLALGLTAVALLALAAVSVTFDVSAARGARALPREVIDVFRVVTRFGESNWLFALSILTLAGAFFARAKAVTRFSRAAFGLLAGQALYVFAVLSVSGLASQAIKHVIGRARPPLLDKVGPYYFEMFSTTGIMASFPSGHTITVFATTAALGLIQPRWTAPLLLMFALPVLASRIIVGSHYPSDVCAGALIGLASAHLVALVFARRKIAFTVAPDSLWPRARRLKPRRAGA